LRRGYQSSSIVEVRELVFRKPDRSSC